jgi:methionine sulfoxide reductase catalytic subunit
MLIRRPDDIPSRDITPEGLYLGRREWLTAAGISLSALAPLTLAGCTKAEAKVEELPQDDKPTPYDVATSYNNYYEFGTGKEDPKKYAGALTTDPWSVEVEGEVARPGIVPLEDLLKGLPTVERVYRHRCVEAWSMIIPWNGILLKDLIAKLAPTSQAKFVEFTTLNRPKEMIGQRGPGLPWPYVEALRMDEAMHPLTMLSTGIYGRPMPNQNGAPLRLVVPWKYGFKGGKAIVKIRFTREMPRTTWNRVLPGEYGFYANVNPEVDHPRWSQARERRVGDFLKRPTLMFNGYADQVASLYTGMDLRRNY